VHEGGLWAGLTGRLQHVEGADGIGIEVVKWDGCRSVMAGLGGCVDDGVWTDLGDELENSLAVADIQFVVDKALQLSLEALLVPTGIPLRAEENGALVVINSVNLVAEFLGEVVTHLGADEA